MPACTRAWPAEPQRRRASGSPRWPAACGYTVQTSVSTAPQYAPLPQPDPAHPSARRAWRQAGARRLHRCGEVEHGPASPSTCAWASATRMRRASRRAATSRFQGLQVVGRQRRQLHPPGVQALLHDPGHADDAPKPATATTSTRPTRAIFGPLGCPAAGLMGVPAAGLPRRVDSRARRFVRVPRQRAHACASLAEISNPDGTPVDASKYFFDSRTGMLFFYVQQTAPNAHGAAPLGSLPHAGPVGRRSRLPWRQRSRHLLRLPGAGLQQLLGEAQRSQLPAWPFGLRCARRRRRLTQPGYTLTEPVQTNHLAAGAGGSIVTPILTASPGVALPALGADAATRLRRRTRRRGRRSDGRCRPCARCETAGTRPAVRRQRDDLFTRVSALVRDPFALFHSQHAHDIDSSMLSQICTARGG